VSYAHEGTEVKGDRGIGASAAQGNVRSTTQVRTVVAADVSKWAAGTGVRCAMRARRARTGLRHVPGKANAGALCASCNIGIHSCKPLAHRHERLPIVPSCSALADGQSLCGIGSTTRQPRLPAHCHVCKTACQNSSNWSRECFVNCLKILTLVEHLHQPLGRRREIITPTPLRFARRMGIITPLQNNHRRVSIVAWTESVRHTCWSLPGAFTFGRTGASPLVPPKSLPNAVGGAGAENLAHSRPLNLFFIRRGANLDSAHPVETPRTGGE
jgi:hypothetical protein